MATSAWQDVMDLGKNDNRHRDVANTLDKGEVTTIIATAEFFGADDNDLQLIHFDLLYARYRVFDWLAMGVMSRIDCRQAVQVFVHSFLKVDGDVDAFIADLRESDYDIDHSWESVELEVVT